MGLMHELVKYRIEEWAEKGKSISYKLAWYIVNAEQLDGMIWLLMKGNRSKEEIMASVKVSKRFLEISMKRHGKEGHNRKEWKVEVLEQIAEARAMELKCPEMKYDKELFEKEWSLRMQEKSTYVKIFLTESDFSSQRIAELVGVSVAFVEGMRKTLKPKNAAPKTGGYKKRPPPKEDGRAKTSQNKIGYRITSSASAYRHRCCGRSRRD